MTKNKRGDELTFCIDWRGIGFTKDRLYSITKNFKALGNSGYKPMWTVNLYHSFRRPYKNELKLKIN